MRAGEKSAEAIVVCHEPGAAIGPLKLDTGRLGTMKGRTKHRCQTTAQRVASPLPPVRPGQAQLAAMGSMVRHQPKPQRGPSVCSTHRVWMKLHHGAETKVKAP